MYIHQVNFENFCFFKNIKLDLWSNSKPDEKIFIFIGENGSAKSTILEGISLLLSRFISSLKSEIPSGPPIPDLKIRKGTLFSNCRVEMTVIKLK